MNTCVRSFIPGLFFAAFLLAAARPARACMCAPTSAEEASRAAVAIFEGLVLAVESADADGDMAPTQLRVHMRVIESWTRGTAEEVVVRTAASGAACGYHFEVGRSYLVYVDVGTADAPAVSICSGTKPREDASADRQRLGMGVVPVSPSQPTLASSTGVVRGGCAGCSIGSRSSNATSSMPLVIMTLGLLAMRVRRVRLVR
jgi:hypothetical protein